MLRRAHQAIRSLRGKPYRPLNRIELSRQRLLHNVALVQKQHPGVEIIPILKGNAYGHGLQEVAQMLNGAKGRYVAVDGYFEANAIRAITKKRILVMGYIMPESVRLADTRRCSFAVQDIPGLRAFAALCRPVHIHLELNTGMNRLGLQPDELKPYLVELKKHPQLELEGVMTHLADADNELDASFTARQIAAFDAAVERIRAAGFNPKIIHVAQTAGSTHAPSRYANAIRLGIGAYGINPLSAANKNHKILNDLQPVLEIKSTIIKVLDLKKGDRVSYGLTFTAPKAMRAGVIAMGYYEGVPRELSGSGYFTTLDGKRLPILGRVNMNHTIFDISGTDLKQHDELLVLSSDPKQPNSVAGWQRQHGLFEYTTLTNLSSTIRREIV